MSIAEKLEEPLMNFLGQYEKVTWGKAQSEYKKLYEVGKGNARGWNTSYQSAFLSLKNKGKISLQQCDDNHPGWAVCKTCEIIVG